MEVDFIPEPVYWGHAATGFGSCCHVDDHDRAFGLDSAVCPGGSAWWETRMLCCGGSGGQQRVLQHDFAAAGDGASGRERNTGFGLRELPAESRIVDKKRPPVRESSAESASGTFTRPNP